MSTEQKPIISLSSDQSYNLSKQSYLTKNIIFISHIPESLFSKDILYQKKFLGQYGHINQMVLLNHKNEKNVIAQFDTVNQAALAILCLQNLKINNDVKLKAIYFTTKYCYYFLNNKECPNPNCLFLHNLQINNYLLLELKNNKYIDSMKFALGVLNISKKVFEAIYFKLIGENYYELQKKFPKMTMKKIKNEDFIKSLYPLIKNININKRLNKKKLNKKKNDKIILKKKSIKSNDSNIENLTSTSEESKSIDMDKINVSIINKNLIKLNRKTKSRFDFVKNINDIYIEQNLRVLVPNNILDFLDKNIVWLLINKKIINDDNENDICNMKNYINFNCNAKV